MLYHCINNNLYQYFALLCKYRKTDIGIVNGVNKSDFVETDGYTPLTRLLTSDHCSNEWLSLLLSFDNIDLNKRCKKKGKHFNKHPLELAKDEFKQMVIDRM